MALTIVDVLEIFCILPWVVSLTLSSLYIIWFIFFNLAALFSNVGLIALTLSPSIIIITLCAFFLSLANLGNQGNVHYSLAFRWNFIQFSVHWDNPPLTTEDYPQSETLAEEEPAVQYDWSSWNMSGELQPVQQLELGEVNIEEQAAIAQSLGLAGRTTEMPVHQERDAHFTFNPATQQWEANGPVDEWTVDVRLDA